MTNKVKNVKESIYHALRTLNAAHTELTDLSKELEAAGVNSENLFGEDVPEFQALFGRVYDLASDAGVDTDELP